MQEIAFGEIGMTADEFWNSSPIEFHYRQKGYFRKVERLEQNKWERTRWLAFLMKIESKPQRKGFLSIQDLTVFPWEEKEIKAVSKPIDPEKLRRLEAAMDAQASNQKTK